MTKAEQFTAAATAIIAEYKKAVAPMLAIHAKFSARWQETDGAAIDAQKAYDAAEAEYNAKVKPTPKALQTGEYKRIKEAWEIRKAELLKPLEAACQARKKADMLVNLAAVPIVRIQAAARMKIYKAYLSVYNLPQLKANSPRLDTLRNYADEIACPNYSRRILLSGAEAYCDPTHGGNAITPDTVQKVIDFNENELADALKTECEILDRIDLIERAQQQLAAFKATYEKNASALYHLMDGLKERTAVYDNLKEIRIDTYTKK